MPGLSLYRRMLRVWKIGRHAHGRNKPLLSTVDAPVSSPVIPRASSASKYLVPYSMSTSIPFPVGPLNTRERTTALSIHVTPVPPASTKPVSIGGITGAPAPVSNMIADASSDFIAAPSTRSMCQVSLMVWMSQMVPKRATQLVRHDL